MIVRESETGFVLIRQHDHGCISGDFADHWTGGGRPGSSLRTAVRWHDVGWEELDGEVRFNPETGRPYSFVDYPMADKLAAYRHGLDRVEAMDATAGCLCSIHYASFFEGTSDPDGIRFLEEERCRRERLKAGMSPEERERLDEGWEFLRLCDDLSLFVCLNPPGKNLHPWYRRGIRYGDGKLLPRWESASALTLGADLIDREFTLRVPYREVGPKGDDRGMGTYGIRVRRRTL